MGRVQAGRTVQTLGIVSTADYTGSELAQRTTVPLCFSHSCSEAVALNLPIAAAL